MSTKYEVVLGPAAIRTVLGLPDPERKELADALRTELLDGPNADEEARFDGPDNVVYRGTPLSFDAYVALHRPMTKEELKRLRREQGRGWPPRASLCRIFCTPARHSHAGRGSSGTSSTAAAFH